MPRFQIWNPRRQHEGMCSNMIYIMEWRRTAPTQWSLPLLVHVLLYVRRTRMTSTIDKASICTIVVLVSGPYAMPLARACREDCVARFAREICYEKALQVLVHSYDVRPTLHHFPSIAGTLCLVYWLLSCTYDGNDRQEYHSMCRDLGMLAMSTLPWIC